MHFDGIDDAPSVRLGNMTVNIEVSGRFWERDSGVLKDGLNLELAGEARRLSEAECLVEHVFFFF